MKPEQNREDIYRDLHGNHLVNEKLGNRLSAQRVLAFVFRFFRPDSALDVGCGLGTWLSVARSLGVREIKGIEGPWLDCNRLAVEGEIIGMHDLESPFELGRRFDLVLSLEVAEHLAETSAQRFVDTLVRHGDVVLFSAAIPQQGGHHHKNEQWPQYWGELFAARDYVCMDLLRPTLWHDGQVYGHLRQNMLLYVSKQRMDQTPFPELANGCRTGPPLALVHPEVYSGHFGNLNQWKELATRNELLIRKLSRGGQYRVKAENGEIQLTCRASSERGDDLHWDDMTVERGRLSHSIESEIKRGERLFQNGDAASALKVFEAILQALMIKT